MANPVHAGAVSANHDVQADARQTAVVNGRRWNAAPERTSFLARLRNLFFAVLAYRSSPEYDFQPGLGTQAAYYVMQRMRSQPEGNHARISI